MKTTKKPRTFPKWELTAFSKGSGHLVAALFACFFKDICMSVCLVLRENSEGVFAYAHIV